MKKFIVVGAGILGASTAYHLAKLGASVTVIDRKDKGQATDAAAGIICPWLSQRRNKAWYALAKSGAAYYEPLIQALEADGETETGYRKVGAISLHTDTAKLAAIEERATSRRIDAPEIGEVYQLNQEDTNQLFPLLDEDYSSVYVSGAARVNGRALRDALVNGAKKYGADFIEGSAELIHDALNVVGVKVGGQSIKANHVIVTAGAWASELLSPLGIDLQVKGQKAQIAHLQVEHIESTHWPVVMPPTNQYLLAFDHGEIIAGATYEDDKEGDLNVTVGGMHEILHKAIQVAPDLKDATYKETRVGFRPVTPNFMPIIGKVPQTTGLLLANGLGASGLTVGPYLGQQLANLAVGKKVEIDLELYSIDHALPK